MTNPTKNPDELAAPLDLLLTNSTRGIAGRGHIDLVTNAAEFVPVIEAFLRTPGEP